MCALLREKSFKLVLPNFNDSGQRRFNLAPIYSNSESCLPVRSSVFATVDTTFTFGSVFKRFQLYIDQNVIFKLTNRVPFVIWYYNNYYVA